MEPKTTVHNAASAPRGEGLTPEQIKRLIELHKLNPVYTVTKILALYGLFAFSGWCILTFPYWYVRIPAYVLSASVFAGLGLIMHDGTHGLLFRNRVANHIASQIVGATIMVAFTQFRYQHLFHHREAMTEGDRDKALYLKNFPYAVLNAGQSLYRSTIAGLKTAEPQLRTLFRVELAAVYLLMLAVIGHCIYHGQFMAFVHVYLIPLLVFSPLLVARLLIEHYDCSNDNEYTMSRTVRSNFIIRFLWSNANYHTVHHFWPKMPWYNLKEAHELIEPHLIANGAHIDDGYVQVFLRALRTYGTKRPPYWYFPPKDQVTWKLRRPLLRMPTARPVKEEPASLEAA
jgi:fatty acid desaturase